MPYQVNLEFLFIFVIVLLIWGIVQIEECLDRLNKILEALAQKEGGK